MEWPLMSDEELHAFGIQSILPYIEKEGVKIEFVNPKFGSIPQIVGERWGSLAYIYVATACFPNKGDFSQIDRLALLLWAKDHSATAFFARVGIICVNYPDHSPVTNEADKSLPIRNAGFYVSYEGLQLMEDPRNITLIGEAKEKHGEALDRAKKLYDDLFGE